MTATVIDGITDAIVALLAALPQLSDPAAVELEPSGDPDTFPALGVMVTGAEPIEGECGTIRWQMGLTIEGYVENGDGAEASAERAGLHADAVAAIMADDTLGGLVENVEPGGFRFATAELASSRRLAFSQDFAIQFTTSRSNPALPA
jgi:hypothetical protein